MSRLASWRYMNSSVSGVVVLLCTALLLVVCEGIDMVIEAELYTKNINPMLTPANSNGVPITNECKWVRGSGQPPQFTGSTVVPGPASNNGWVMATHPCGPFLSPTSTKVLETPRLDYSVQFTEIGTYRLWVRAYCPNPGPLTPNNYDSFYMTVDGFWPPMFTGNGFCTDGAAYNYGIQFDWNTKDLGTFTINDITVLHTITLWNREPLLLIDKFIITLSSSGFTPPLNGVLTTVNPPQTVPGDLLAVEIINPVYSKPLLLPIPPPTPPTPVPVVAPTPGIPTPTPTPQPTPTPVGSNPSCPLLFDCPIGSAISSPLPNTPCIAAVCSAGECCTRTPKCSVAVCTIGYVAIDPLPNFDCAKNPCSPAECCIFSGAPIPPTPPVPTPIASPTPTPSSIFPVPGTSPTPTTPTPSSPTALQGAAVESPQAKESGSSIVLIIGAIGGVAVMAAILLVVRNRKNKKLTERQTRANSTNALTGRRSGGASSRGQSGTIPVTHSDSESRRGSVSKKRGSVSKSKKKEEGGAAEVDDDSWREFENTAYDAEDDGDDDDMVQVDVLEKNERGEHILRKKSMNAIVAAATKKRIDEELEDWKTKMEMERVTGNGPTHTKSKSNMRNSLFSRKNVEEEDFDLEEKTMGGTRRKSYGGHRQEHPATETIHDQHLIICPPQE